jgi:hypothetical protein
MKIPHLLALPLVLSAAFAAAQSTPISPLASPASSQPATHFDPKHPCASAVVICETFGAPSTQPQLPFKIKPSWASEVKPIPTLVVLNVHPISTCYKVRAYEYTLVKPNTDQIRWTGTTDCQPSTSFHMKSAIQEVRNGNVQ